MDKVKQLANEMYNQKVLDGWKNVSMKTETEKAKQIILTPIDSTTTTTN